NAASHISAGKDDLMAPEQVRVSTLSLPGTCIERRSAESYERELAEHKNLEGSLRRDIARQEAVIHERDESIRQHRLSSQESDHRLLNGLQMIVSVLSLQSRDEPNADAASHLAIAANRVATIARVHRRLHSLDGRQTVRFKRYLDELCGEYSKMLASEVRWKLELVVAGNEVELPTATAVPLSLIVNELITNALKHGKGRIAVVLEPDPVKGHALSVFNDGSVLPEGFDPMACKGLGMTIVAALVGQIGGELRTDRGESNDGTRFTVLFP
ncbi:MAG: sensor histidine kinase, partial [Reyranella sp.]|nr:sensor histidine kinase [Reyranella sp.]